MEPSETKRMAPFLIERHGQEEGVQESMAYISVQAVGQRQSHRQRVASPALVGLAECLRPDGKRECNDEFFVRLPLAPCFSPTGQRPKGSGGERVS